jgi:hypothetical protein
MKIIKHGNLDIVKNWTTTFTCTRCECEFAANLSDLTHDLADGADAVTVFAKLLSDIEHPEKTHCPDCGQELSKTKAEIIAEGQELGKDEN